MAPEADQTSKRSEPATTASDHQMYAKKHGGACIAPKAACMKNAVESKKAKPARIHEQL
jgi:hypothetical protein